MDLSVNGQTLTRVCFDYGITILTDAEAEFRIETTFDLEVDGVTHSRVDPSDASRVASILVSSLNHGLSMGRVDDTGKLELHVGDSVVFRVPPDEEYEAWSYSDSEEMRLTCPPGGGIVSWERRVEKS